MGPVPMVCRAAWLLLVGCSHAASRPAAAPEQARVAPPASVPAASPARASNKTHARILVGSDEWMDITFEGADDATRAVCTHYVDSLLTGLPRDKFRLQQRCEPVELPPAPSAPPLLVSVQVIDNAAVDVEDMLHGRSPQDAAPRPEVHGQLVVYKPFATAAACNALLAEVTAQEQRMWLDAERDRIARIDQRLSEAIKNQIEACDTATAMQARCTKLRGDARTECLLETSPKQIVCDEMTRQRTQLEDMRAARPHPVGTSRRCR